MQTYTWIPGTEPELDNIFEQARQIQYNDRSHRLWENYDLKSFEEVSALTISFNDDFVPEVCSSILTRDCWPTNAYRILNRTWRHTNRLIGARETISPEFADCARSQIEWLNGNIEPDLIFISRQTDNWMKWVVKHFDQGYKMKFKIADGKYLTCPNECDDSCWQHIIYQGSKKFLKGWKKRD